jgi:hypothetical protein
MIGRITADPISGEELVDRLNTALDPPGVSKVRTMPVKARIDMLTTGVRTAAFSRRFCWNWRSTRRCARCGNGRSISGRRRGMFADLSAP